MDNNQTIELLKQILEQLRKIRFEQLLRNNPITKDWIPKDIVKDYLGYADTQMAAVERSHGLKVSQIGKRKFYHKDSINNLLEDSVN